MTMKGGKNDGVPCRTEHFPKPSQGPPMIGPYA